MISRIPGSEIIYRYIKSSHQNNPFRTLLKMLLVFFIISPGDKVDKIIAEWEPEPLVENIPVTSQSLLCPPIIIGIPDIRPKILYGEPALRLTESMEGAAMIYPKDIRTVTNLASINFGGLIGDKCIKL
ncbi:hypothetical protein PPACK8108_LOCUS18099 [Phakopsora pachyrhizi]|uniref:Uncharacterized protein n=1 Tax=Phakopsora pachyrhizi TaxID=170000 RepID=A0AAV0BCU8_PHAPC|nr:hypothetical protein PPACK8108_LOCUS18099 [Phakopsora pachyrhizi]